MKWSIVNYGKKGATSDAIGKLSITAETEVEARHVRKVYDTILDLLLSPEIVGGKTGGETKRKNLWKNSNPISVRCEKCGWFPEESVKRMIDICEGPAGEDIVTFECLLCGKTRKSRRYGGGRPPEVALK